MPVSYKSNDAILCQLFRDGKINIENLGDYRKDIRKITYSKIQDDHSVILVTEVVDNDLFLALVQDTSVILFFSKSRKNFQSCLIQLNWKGRNKQDT